MARIDGPKPTSVGQLERKPLAPLEVTRPMAKSEAPESQFVDRAKKLISTTGGFKAVPIPDALRSDLKAFVAGQMKGGAIAKTSGNSLSIKGGEAKASTKAVSPQGFASSVAGKPMQEVTGSMSLLSASEKAAIGKAIHAGKVEDPKVIAAWVELQPSSADAAKVMLKLGDKQIDQLKALMRTGEAPDVVSVGVGVRIAAKSDWGKAHPEVIKTLQTGYVEGKVRIASSDANIAGLGMTSATGIDVGNQLRKSPEALAATLAHEGEHLHGGSGCCGGDATPAGELAGMGATASIWAQYGNKAEPSLKPQSLALLNDLAAAKDNPKAFKDKVLGAYVGFYQSKIEKLEVKIAKGDARYLAFQKSKTPMPPAELDALLKRKDELAYLQKTEAAFHGAWKANEKT